MSRLACICLITISALISASYGYECPESLKQTCIECDIDNKCVKCKLGYFKTQGICLQCDAGCIECRSLQLCDSCDSGFVLKEGLCKGCHANCKTCQFDENYCTSCKSDYKLDDRSMCHYRYALLLFLVALGLIIGFLTCIMVLIKKCLSRRRPKPAQYGSVLDKDILRRPYHESKVVSVEEIGKTIEQNDISVVGNGKGGSTAKSFLEADDESDEGSTKEIITQISRGDLDSQPVHGAVLVRQNRKSTKQR